MEMPTTFLADSMFRGESNLLLQKFKNNRLVLALPLASIKKKKANSRHDRILCKYLGSAENRCFSDVKIVCRDGSIRAHRLVLAAASPRFLKKLLEEENHQQQSLTTLIFPEVSIGDMSRVLCLIYKGETTLESNVDATRYHNCIKLISSMGISIEDFVVETKTVGKVGKKVENHSSKEDQFLSPQLPTTVIKKELQLPTEEVKQRRRLLVQPNKAESDSGKAAVNKGMTQKINVSGAQNAIIIFQCKQPSTSATETASTRNPPPVTSQKSMRQDILGEYCKDEDDDDTISTDYYETAFDKEATKSTIFRFCSDPNSRSSRETPFSNDYDLAEDNDDASSEDDDTDSSIQYRCDLCGKRFHLLEFLRHQEVHKDDFPYRCANGSCGGRFKTLSEFRTHRRVSHKTSAAVSNNNVAPCPICGKTFKFAASLRAHLQSHESRKKAEEQEEEAMNGVFSCRLCGTAHNSWEKFSGHLLAAHGSRVALKYKCAACQQCFSLHAEYLAHLAEKHKKLSPPPPPPPPIPKRTSPSPLLLSSIQSLREPLPQQSLLPHPKPTEMLNNVIPPRRQCGICLTPFTSAKSHKRHMEQCHSASGAGTRHVCAICQKVFKRSDNLSAHHRAVHCGLKPNKCSRCHRGYRTKNELKRHVDNCCNNRANLQQQQQWKETTRAALSLARNSSTMSDVTTSSEMDEIAAMPSLQFDVADIMDFDPYIGTF